MPRKKSNLSYRTKNAKRMRKCRASETAVDRNYRLTVSRERSRRLRLHSKIFDLFWSNNHRSDIKCNVQNTCSDHGYTGAMSEVCTYCHTRKWEEESKRIDLQTVGKEDMTYIQNNMTIQGNRSSTPGPCSIRKRTDFSVENMLNDSDKNIKLEYLLKCREYSE